MKILMIATVAGVFDFFVPLIRELTRRGDEVDIACNQTERLKAPLNRLCHRVWEIPCSRTPLKKSNLTAIKVIRQIVDQGHYDLVHCHTPIAAFCTRAACRKFRKKGLKVVYTAHGFHFYKGASWKNWLLFYPVEWLSSFWTDVLITITKEDYQRACRRFHAKRTEYLPGVGIDVQQIKNTVVEKSAKRREIGIPENALLLLSAGELNGNKNHRFVLRVLSQPEAPQVHYAIAGRGDQQENLKTLAQTGGIADRVHVLGWRTDVVELCRAADVYLLPSKREGLNVSVMEAMACGLPVVCNDIRGNRDLIADGKGGFVCALNDEKAWLEAVQRLCRTPELREEMAAYNLGAVNQYSEEAILEQTIALYRGLM